MKTRSVIGLLLLVSTGRRAWSQTALANFFDKLRSLDPMVVAAARASGPAVMKDMLSTIDESTPSLCRAVNDPDSYIQLQATAILVTIVRIAPEHTSVVETCAPNLIMTATDHTDRVRNNALFALVMSNAGPPKAARTVLISSLASGNLRTSELGAAGLIKLGEDERVRAAVEATSDPVQQVNLLYAISGVNVKSARLFEATQRLLSSEKKEVQAVAVDAVAATAPDPQKAAMALQPILDSAATSADVKQSAQAALSRLGGNQ